MQKILILIVRFLISLIDCLDVVFSALRMRCSLIIEWCKRKDGNNITNASVEEKKIKRTIWLARLFARMFGLNKSFIVFHVRNIRAKMEESKRQQSTQRQSAED